MNISELEIIGCKYLSTVEINHFQSNQHELHGIKAFKIILGAQTLRIKSHIYYIDSDLNVSSATSQMTWYDARESHPTRSEYRLYYSDNNIFNNAQVDDMLLLCKSINNRYIVILIRKNNTVYKFIHNNLHLIPIGESYIINSSPDRDFIMRLWELCENNLNLNFAKSYLINGFQSN